MTSKSWCADCGGDPLGEHVEDPRVGKRGAKNPKEKVLKERLKGLLAS